MRRVTLRSRRVTRALVVLAVTIPAPAVPGEIAPPGPLAWHGPLQASGRMANQTVNSTNWSGYAVGKWGHPITAVSTQFVQPAFGYTPPGYAAIWAGIGGYRTSDLIQAGTSVSPPVAPSTAPSYYAWFELLPNTEQRILGCTGDAKCTVKPGQHMAIAIKQTAATKWLVIIVDASHWSWRRTVTYSSRRLSAEWIVEAPMNGRAQTTLDNIGTVRLSANTFTSAGQTFTVGRGSPDLIKLVPGQATPSPIVSGKLFNVCAWRSSCAHP